MKDKNNNISNDFYEKMLEKSTKKPYAIRFKWVRIIMWMGSIFGNFASIFFAYFFFSSLFSSSLIDIDGWYVSAGIITFLTIFELLKRYVFDLFSLEFIKVGKSILNKSMISFILSTGILISFSIFFSLNGAKNFMDKEKQIYTQNKEEMENELDSINKYYMENYISPVKEENKQYLSQKNEILEQRKKFVDKGWETKNFDQDLESLDKMINKNRESLEKYEERRDEKIEEHKQTYITSFNRKTEENETNIIWFLLISFSIEILILSGVYYIRHYEDITVKEYQREVASKPNYKKWKKCERILEMIYETGVQLDDQISSTNEIIELVSINEMNFSRSDIDNAFKVFGHLNIYQRTGNKRILKMKSEDAYEVLKKHFKIK